jgi:hypothetical protein
MWSGYPLIAAINAKRCRIAATFSLGTQGIVEEPALQRANWLLVGRWGRRWYRRYLRHVRCILEVRNPYAAVLKQPNQYFGRPSRAAITPSTHRAFTYAEQPGGSCLPEAERGERGAERNGVAAEVCSSAAHVTPNAP